MIKIGYQAVLDDPRSEYTYAHQALSNVQVVGSAIGPQEARYKNDAQAAYLNALRWVKTGDTRHRDKAIAILNDWAQHLPQLLGRLGHELRAGLARGGVDAAGVGQRGRDHPPLQQRRGGLVAGRHRDLQRLRRPPVRAGRAGPARVNNWAVSAGLAMMAAGAYQDNAARYSAGLQRIMEMIPLSVFSSGEVNELKDRDCTHPQYNLEGLSQAAEIEVIQTGDTSVWMWKGSGETTPRLAKGLEYMAKSLANGSGVRNCKGQHLEAGYMDIAVNGYMNRGVAIPNFQALAKARRPDAGSMQFLGFTTATHGRDDY